MMLLRRSSIIVLTTLLSAILFVATAGATYAQSTPAPTLRPSGSGAPTLRGQETRNGDLDPSLIYIGVLGFFLALLIGLVVVTLLVRSGFFDRPEEQSVTG